MDCLKLELFRLGINAGVQQTADILGITRGHWNKLTKGERNITKDVIEKIEHVLSMRNKMLTDMEKKLQKQGVENACLVLFPEPVDTGGITELVLHNSIVTELFCKHPSIKVVSFNKETSLKRHNKKS